MVVVVVVAAVVVAVMMVVVVVVLVGLTLLLPLSFLLSFPSPDSLCPILRLVFFVSSFLSLHCCTCRVLCFT